MPAVLDIYHQYLPNLKRQSAKSDEWKCICPFHNEKTPSFSVNQKTGYFYCFGCGKAGGVKKFMELIGADTSKEIAFKQEEPTNEHIILSREITPKLIEQMHRNLLNEERRLSYLLRQRLISFISIRR